jgi:glutamine synthetase
MSEMEREELGIRERLPGSMAEALVVLGSDEVLSGIMGKELVERYLKLKREEARTLEKMGSDQRARLGVQFF